MGDNEHRRVSRHLRFPMSPLRLVPAVAAAVLAILSMEQGATARQNASTPRPYQERDFLSRIRRLTVEGRRAGEGYWSPDGNRIVFQSEREPGNPFYQIYTLDLTTGDTKRISPGTG